MTTRDFCIKWLAYGLALLPVWLLELFVLSRYPFMGIKPMLLPLAAVAVAALEGPSGGAGFGLACAFAGRSSSNQSGASASSNGGGASSSPGGGGKSSFAATGST